MRARDESGVAFPSPLVMLSVIAVTMAGVAFVSTRGDDGGALETVSQPEITTPTVSVPPPVVTRSPTRPTVKRNEVNVEVYNNSGVKGLAGRTATEASTVGWNVVGSDNWVGTIPAPTIYHGPRLAAAAKLLGKDLGISRIRPSVDPMRPDRLTVILTASYS